MSEAMKDSRVEWIGAIPEGWNVKRMKDVLLFQSGDTISAEQISEKSDETPYPVYGGNGIRGYFNAFNSDGHVPLIGRQGALCGNINIANGRFWATEHAVRVKSTLKTINLQWVGKMLDVMNLNQHATQSAQPGLSVEKIRPLLIPLPPLAEQQAIADFLDRETSLIDQRMALIGKKRGLLRELRKSVVHEAVTKGLENGVAMKDSGVEWIGEIPAGWKAVRPKDVAEIQRSGDKSQGEKPLLSAKAIREKVAEVYLSKGVPVSMGDVLLLWDGSNSGEFFNAPMSGYLSSTMARLRKRHKNFNTSFLLYSFQVLVEPKLRAYITGAGIPHVSPDELARSILLEPPLAEQQAIAEFLDRETGRIDKMVSILDRQESLLNEQRKALVHEVVTGKRRVI